MIDVTKPLRLSSGTPAKYVKRRDYDGRPAVTVRIEGPYRKGRPTPCIKTWNYYLDTGEWCGADGNPDYYTLVQDVPSIDTSKPLEAVCKSTGRVVPMEYSSSGTYFGKPIFHTKKGPCDRTSNSTWHADGRDCCSRDAWYIRNVESIDWNGKLRTREGSSIVTLEGTLEDGRRVVSFRRFGSKITQIVYADGRVDDRKGRTSGDDVVNPHVPLVREYRNVYADGSVGSSVHGEWTDCLDRSKFGKTRVGVLINETRGGVILSSRVQPTEPQLRTRDNPAGINPFK